MNLLRSHLSNYVSWIVSISEHQQSRHLQERINLADTILTSYQVRSVHHVVIVITDTAIPPIHHLVSIIHLNLHTHVPPQVPIYNLSPPKTQHSFRELKTG